MQEFPKRFQNLLAIVGCLHSALPVIISSIDWKRSSVTIFLRFFLQFIQKYIQRLFRNLAENLDICLRISPEVYSLMQVIKKSNGPNMFFLIILQKCSSRTIRNFNYWHSRILRKDSKSSSGVSWKAPHGSFPQDFMCDFF